jgi:tetratricopeptide (TPR) repeat protein
LESGNSIDKAIAHLEKAVSLQPKYALHFAELDELYEATGTAPEKRLEMLEKNHAVVEQRDDALAHEIALLITLGKYDKALQYLTGREFSVWEGGNLNVAESWTNAHLLRGQQLLAAKHYREALTEFTMALEIPANLPSEEFNTDARAPEVNYWIGSTDALLGEGEKAKQYWEKAAAAKTASARSRRQTGSHLSPQTAQRYYQALSLRKLGQADKVNAILQGLVEAANQEFQRTPAAFDLSASYAKLRLQRSSLALAHYVAGLGYLGLDDKSKARQEFAAALKASPDHIGARSMLAGL